MYNQKLFQNFNTLNHKVPKKISIQNREQQNETNMKT